MSEFVENRWSVVSERGREAAGLTYERARELLNQLLRENVHGTVIVTDEAGRRVAQSTPLKMK